MNETERASYNMAEYSKTMRRLNRPLPRDHVFNKGKSNYHYELDNHWERGLRNRKRQFWYDPCYHWQPRDGWVRKRRFCPNLFWYRTTYGSHFGAIDYPPHPIPQWTKYQCVKCEIWYQIPTPAIETNWSKTHGSFLYRHGPTATCKSCYNGGDDWIQVLNSKNLAP